jgi:imidazolonepropionase-like amidohydrolase
MRRKLIVLAGSAFALVFALTFLARAGDSSAPSSDSLVILHANVIDGISDAPLKDATVVVVNGHIQSIGHDTPQTAGPAQVLDLKGKWLLPGFVDAHAHIGDLASARRAVRSGTTTARDMGVNHFADIGIRELNHAGVSDVPDIVAAGYHVRPHPADEFFLDFPQLADLMGGVHGAESVRRMVRAMASHGVNVIKVMATQRAGLPETDPRLREFSDEELNAVVDEANKAGLWVAAHAHGDEGAAAAVRAGVHSIEHGTFLNDDTLRLMKEKSVYFVPTIATVQDLIDPGGDYDDPILQIRGRAMMPRVREVTSKAWKMGIKIVAGTDTGYLPRSNRRIPDEIVEFVNVGIPPMDAIKAATSVAAQCLGVEKRTGSIRTGYEGDFVIVDRNPLDDIRNVQDVLIVINNGRIAVNRLNP